MMMNLPPIAKKNYFITVYEYLYGKRYKVYPNVLTDYSEAQKVRIFNEPYLTDSFLRAFDTLEEAQRFIDSHEKKEVA